MITKPFTERRVKKPSPHYLLLQPNERRATVHNYSSPPKLCEVWIQVEPQPPVDAEKHWIEELAPKLRPGDVIKEVWMDTPEHDMIDRFEWFSASTMPESLNNLCHKVLAVLDVCCLEKDSFDGDWPMMAGQRPEPIKIWYWKYLTTRGD
jgi:hypothetical protein